MSGCESWRRRGISRRLRRKVGGSFGHGAVERARQERLCLDSGLGRIGSAMKTTLFAGAFFSLIAVVAAEKPIFREQNVDTNVVIGYGLAIADVNGDGKKDVLLADKNLIVWYENPSWSKHV